MEGNAVHTVAGTDGEELARASVRELIAQLALAEDGMREAARDPRLPVQDAAERAEAIVKELHRRALTPPGRAEPQQVIVRGSSGEIHGYAVETDGDRVQVVWQAASGGLGQRIVPAEEVFLPSSTDPWSGQSITPGQLRSHHRSGP